MKAANFTGPDAALIAAAHELLAAARKVDALSIPGRVNRFTTVVETIHEP